MTFLNPTLSSTQITSDCNETIQHLYEPEHITAVNAALAIQRPLLILGETGIGKSQLAKAVAQELKRVYLPFVCDAHTESRDLLWEFDAVERLADAQVQGVLPPEERKDLAVANYILPRPLWWALNWKSAAKTTKGKQHIPHYDASKADPSKGCVVLIDEIDKAASDVPNGLLEALGSGRFQPQGMAAIERDSAAPPPLVVVCSNAERNLPDAFVRRCLVLHLDFPKEREQQIKFLVKRGEANFSEFKDSNVEGLDGKPCSLLELAAQMLVEDRKAAQAQHLYTLAGQAEYVDLLRALQKLAGQDDKDARSLLEALRPYTLRKVRESR